MAKVPYKQRKMKGAAREELLNLDKEDLVDRIIQMEAHITQLKNIINKNHLVPSEKVEAEGEKFHGKSFDFAKCHYRRILLRVLYFGWDYQGLAVQEDTTQTVEHHLFYALTKSCLIQSRETSNYHRCGRTDKGVSSFGQVISITVRSKHAPSDQNKEESITTEMPYCKILNRLLPKEIRAVAWLPIPQDKTEYSARFDCYKRRYKYYFPRSNLDLSAMRAACPLLIGSHDFRHLCKMDVGNGVTEFIRRIFSASILSVEEKDSEDPTSMYYLQIEGNAFLWHQIRCIMGLLLLIGQGKESYTVIADLLDVDTNPRLLGHDHGIRRHLEELPNAERLKKPQYHMALDIPLNLFECSYDLDETNWVYDMEELHCVIAHLQGEWTLYSVKATMMKDCLNSLETRYKQLCARQSERGDTCNHEGEGDGVMAKQLCARQSERGDTCNHEGEGDGVMAHIDCLLQGVKPRVYTPLLKRETCSSLEERIKYYNKKRKKHDDNNDDSLKE